MIKTLKITTIIAAVAAVLLLILPVVYGGREDAEVKEFLNSPGAVASFKQARSKQAGRGVDKVSPLVKQAEAFGNYLDPPAPVSRKEPQQRRPTPPSRSEPRPPAPVAVKFDLIGTSFYASHPNLSLVLINEPGAGLRWLRQGNSVGHLVIEQVKDGAVVVRDGQRTFEMSVMKEQRPSLVKGDSPQSQPARSPRPAPTSAGKTTTGRTRTARSSRRITRPEPEPVAEPIGDEEKAAIDELIEQLRKTEGGSEQGDDESERQRQELMRQLLSGLGDMEVDGAEAEELGRLGEELNEQSQHDNQQGDPNTDTEDPNAGQEDPNAGYEE